MINDPILICIAAVVLIGGLGVLTLWLSTRSHRNGPTRDEVDEAACILFRDTGWTEGQIQEFMQRNGSKYFPPRKK